MCISFISVFLCFYVLFAVCVNGPLWTDFSNKWKWNRHIFIAQFQCSYDVNCELTNYLKIRWRLEWKIATWN